ncbi:unnamed protein product [Acanthosepion pharaonis]|uniref:Uncharacterized protein n=1 Tax=Acanthosepion pharaonis TaxID=158019 RepID=A0A812CG64_ACAPH|nr:unnamed protein product [Sepia pharaonis]
MLYPPFSPSSVHCFYPLSSPHPITFTILFPLLQCHSPLSFLSPSYTLLLPPLFLLSPFCIVLCSSSPPPPIHCSILFLFPSHLSSFPPLLSLFLHCALFFFSHLFFPPSDPLPLLYHVPYSFSCTILFFLLHLYSSLSFPGSSSSPSHYHTSSHSLVSSLSSFCLVASFCSIQPLPSWFTYCISQTSFLTCLIDTYSPPYILLPLLTFFLLMLHLT